MAKNISLWQLEVKKQISEKEEDHNLEEPNFRFFYFIKIIFPSNPTSHTAPKISL